MYFNAKSKTTASVSVNSVHSIMETKILVTVVLIFGLFLTWVPFFLLLQRVNQLQEDETQSASILKQENQTKLR